MLIEGYNTVEREFCGELVEKKSRFIATLRPVQNETEAMSFITEMKKKYWDARHNCSAYIVQESDALSGFIEKCNDDGEPSKTAGGPMLEVLKGAELKNVAVVVTRYFGGVLLGTGGLVRAYSQAVSEAIAGAEVVKKRLLNKVSVKTDYNGYGRLQYFAANDNLKLENAVFTADVEAIVLCDDSGLGGLTKKMTEATAGKAVIEVIDKGFY